MRAVLAPINRKGWGMPLQEEIEHDEVARAHFLKYCDTGKCIQRRKGVKGWHEWPCTECYFNPYNMVESEAEAK